MPNNPLHILLFFFMFTSLGLVGQGNINKCFPPTFTLAEPTPTGNVRISWQGNAKHNKYHVQYRKASPNPSQGGEIEAEQYEWFEVYTQNEQAQISNLEAGETYEFRVGGTCNALTQLEQSYTYTSINTFTMPTADESVSYSCGIVPEINITNTTPLENIGVNETFTAGDFPVTVTAISPSPGGGWEGVGFIVVPYLADTKIAVEFSGITINTDYQLIDGIIQTTYDADWGGVMSIDEFVNGIGNAFNDLLDLLNNYDGSEAAQADLNDIINTINDQLESIEGNTAVTDDVKEQLSKLQEDLNSNVQVLTDTDKNPTKENKDAVISSVQEIKEIADSLASQQNTGGVITSVGSDPYFDGVIQGTSTTGSILNESQATLTDNLQNFKSLEIPSGNDDEGNTVTNLKKTVGNFNVYASTSDISDTDFNAIKQNIATINGIGVWLHYSTESNEMKYKINFSDNYFTSPQDKEAYKRVIKKSIEQAPTTDNWGGLVIQSIEGTNKLIREIIESSSLPNNTDLLYDENSMSAIEIIELMIEFMYHCSDNYDIEKGLVPRCLWDNNLNPGAAYMAGIIDGAWEVVIGAADIAKFSSAWSVTNPYFYTDGGKQIRQQTIQFFELAGALYEGEGSIRTDTWDLIETEFTNYVDTTIAVTPQARYNQGKLIFDVASFFFGVGEVKAFLKTGKITSNTVQLLTKIPTNASKVLVALTGKIKKLQNNVLAYALSANTYVEIARFTDDGVIDVTKWLDEGSTLSTIENLRYIDVEGQNKIGDLTLLKQGDEVGFKVVERMVKNVDDYKLFWNTLSDVPKTSQKKYTLWRRVDKSREPAVTHPMQANNTVNRYSRGREAIYFGTSKEVTNAEWLSYNPITGLRGNNGSKLYKFTVNESDLLDLTDPNVLSKLDLSEDLLTKIDDKAIPQALGDWAFDNGYRGVIFPSARKIDGVNVVIFKYFQGNTPPSISAFNLVETIE